MQAGSKFCCEKALKKQNNDVRPGIAVNVMADQDSVVHF